ncbi:outer membrane beta-barrel protein [Tunicatimonas pelagia]|uniref:outer membrane beta-barrel protein n=1 Tax=Tunicatimonas pelagia TaxID=931531 RepID=UPI002666BBD7|nr:outer membrane beta-barrel protein [Tunicatimonas pelagia]WKN43358.1 outer membrane beta-barrel protein [Tunicatimonas pelagia]
MRYLLIVLFLFISLTVHAQQIKVGPVVSALLTRPVFDNPVIAQNNQGQWAPGGGGGISAIFIANNSFSLSTEVLYQYQRKTINGNDGFSYFRESLNFIKAPVLFQYSYPVGYYKLNFMVGPSINYWISGRGEALVPELVEGDLEGGQRYTIAYDGIPENDRFLVSDPNRWQLGLQVGLGTTIPVQRNSLKVDARFEWGHTNMAKSNSTYTPFVFYDMTLDHTFHGFSLSCAYLFSFDLFEMSHKGKSTDKKKK